jgi:hypothetical protein
VEWSEAIGEDERNSVRLSWTATGSKPPVITSFVNILKLEEKVKSNIPEFKKTHREEGFVSDAFLQVLGGELLKPEV